MYLQRRLVYNDKFIHGSLLFPWWIFRQNNQFIRGRCNDKFTHVSLVSPHGRCIQNNKFIHGRRNDKFTHGSLLSLQIKYHNPISKIIMIRVGDLWWPQKQLWCTFTFLLGFGSLFLWRIMYNISTIVDSYVLVIAPLFFSD